MQEDEARKIKVAIIGGGIGGVTSAARLAKAGYQVDLFEKNDFLGGRCANIHKHGFRFDQGPSMYLMPEVFEETFRDLGLMMETGARGNNSMEGDRINHPLDRLNRCSTNALIHFHDGTELRMSSDLASLKTELEAIEPGCFPRFLEWLEVARKHYDKSVKIVLGKHFENLGELVFSWENLMALPYFNLHRKLWEWTCSFFKSDKLRRAFTYQSMYLGMSPFDAPAVYSLLPFTEITGGIWYPEGGMNKIVQKMEKVAKDHGARFYLSTPVHSIIKNESLERANAIMIPSSDPEAGFVSKEYDLVVINADTTYAFKHLLGDLESFTGLESMNHTSSAIVFYWGFSQVLTSLHGHNIFLAEEYSQSFDEIFGTGKEQGKRGLPSQLSFYIHVPSRHDKTAAPPGRDSVMVLVPVGNLGLENSGSSYYGSPEEGKRDPERAQLHSKINTLVRHARTMVLDRLTQTTGIKHLESLILTETVYDPLTWNYRFNLHAGSVLGLSHDILQVLSFRPHLRHGSLANVYFGVPIVTAGAKLLEKLVLHDFPPDQSSPDELASNMQRSLATRRKGFLAKCAEIVVKTIMDKLLVGGSAAKSNATSEATTVNSSSKQDLFSNEDAGQYIFSYFAPFIYAVIGIYLFWILLDSLTAPKKSGWGF